MSKKRKSRLSQKPQRATPHKLVSELARVESLLTRNQPAEALALLEPLAERFPRVYDVFALLFNTAQALHDERTLLQAALRLAEIEPHDPGVQLGLADAYARNLFPALAVNASANFLKRWPEHEQANKVREQVTLLEGILQTEWASIGLASGNAMDLALLHEKAQVALSENQFAEARRLAEAVRAKAPHWVAPLNNISLAHFYEGHIDDAVQAARRVLEIEPDNFHALGNLVHFLCLLGQVDEATTIAGQLKRVDSERGDVWVKKAEALSFLGDYAGVQEVFRQAEQANKRSVLDPLLIHLAAAAAAQMGDEPGARKLWKDALKVAPGFDLARENLADQQKPVAEREGTWSLPLGSWLPPIYVEDLVRLLAALPQKRKQASASLEAVAREFLRTHPVMQSLVPILFARGDPNGRDFAMRLAQMSQTPEMLTALKDFALGRRGTDQQRLLAAQAVADAGLLLRGKPVRMWMRGKWEDSLLLTYEVTGEPQGSLPARLQRKFERAMALLYDERLDEAEPLLVELRAAAPEDIPIQQNLAALYAMRGEEERALTLTRELVEKHPDYLFGRCNMANFAVRAKRYDEAEQWLEPLLSRSKFHVSEFRALLEAHLNLEVERGRLEAAKSWLRMWETYDPDDPKLSHWRLRVEPTPAESLRRLGALFRKLRND